MGRGIHETTKIKKQIKQTSKTAAAIIDAKQQVENKRFKKDFWIIVQKKLLGFIDKIDPLELAAVVASTYVVHGIILTTSELFERAANVSKGLNLISGQPELLAAISSLGGPLSEWVSNIPWLIETILEGQDLSEERQQQIIEGIQTIVERPESDSVFLWATSFAIAYYLQKHGITDIFNGVRGFLGFSPT